MDPITIGLGAGAALLLLKGIKGVAPSSSGNSAIAQGDAVIDYVGSTGAQSTQQAQQAASNVKGTEFKTTLGAAGAGASAGVAAAGAGGAAAGLTAGAVTFGIGALVGLAAVLWAKHEARIKGATTENKAWNLIAPGFAEAMQGIFASYNAGHVSDLTAVAELMDLKSRIYAAAQSYNHQPGVDWAGGGSQPGLAPKTVKFWTVQCDKHCTIGCCLFNNFVGPAINNAINLIKNHATVKSFTVPAMAPKPTYGFKGLPSFTLTVTR